MVSGPPNEEVSALNSQDVDSVPSNKDGSTLGTQAKENVNNKASKVKKRSADEVVELQVKVLKQELVVLKKKEELLDKLHILADAKLESNDLFVFDL